jgi:NADPH:quinone reductase-like Zn-dependent oxidoreductase
VGSLAIQIAAAQGARVSTTCSGANIDLCKELGAETCVDYKTQRFVHSIIRKELHTEAISTGRRGKTALPGVSALVDWESKPLF